MISATFGSTKFTLNGEPLMQDTLVYNGTAYLPAAYFASKLGLSADWYASTNRTYLSYSFASPVDVGITVDSKGDIYWVQDFVG